MRSSVDIVCPSPHKRTVHDCLEASILFLVKLVLAYNLSIALLNEYTTVVFVGMNQV